MSSSESAIPISKHAAWCRALVTALNYDDFTSFRKTIHVAFSGKQLVDVIIRERNFFDIYSSNPDLEKNPEVKAVLDYFLSKRFMIPASSLDGWSLQNALAVAPPQFSLDGIYQWTARMYFPFETTTLDSSSNRNNNDDTTSSSSYVAQLRNYTSTAAATTTSTAPHHINDDDRLLDHIGMDGIDKDAELRRSIHIDPNDLRMFQTTVSPNDDDDDDNNNNNNNNASHFDNHSGKYSSNKNYNNNAGGSYHGSGGHGHGNGVSATSSHFKPLAASAVSGQMGSQTSSPWLIYSDLKGHLDKRRRKKFNLTVYQTRYFKLNIQAQAIEYFATQESFFPAGFIPLQLIESIEAWPNKKGRFDIHTTARVYALRASSDSDGNLWIEALKKALSDFRSSKGLFSPRPKLPLTPNITLPCISTFEFHKEIPDNEIYEDDSILYNNTHNNNHNNHHTTPQIKHLIGTTTNDNNNNNKNQRRSSTTSNTSTSSHYSTQSTASHALTSNIAATADTKSSTLITPVGSSSVGSGGAGGGIFRKRNTYQQQQMTLNMTKNRQNELAAIAKANAEAKIAAEKASSSLISDVHTIDENSPCGDKPTTTPPTATTTLAPSSSHGSSTTTVATTTTTTTTTTLELITPGVTTTLATSPSSSSSSSSSSPVSSTQLVTSPQPPPQQPPLSPSPQTIYKHVFRPTNIKHGSLSMSTLMRQFYQIAFSLSTLEQHNHFERILRVFPTDDSILNLLLQVLTLPDSHYGNEDSSIPALAALSHHAQNTMPKNTLQSSSSVHNPSSSSSPSGTAPSILAPQGGGNKNNNASTPNKPHHTISMSNHLSSIPSQPIFQQYNSSAPVVVSTTSNGGMNNNVVGSPVAIASTALAPSYSGGTLSSHQSSSQCSPGSGGPGLLPPSKYDPSTAHKLFDTTVGPVLENLKQYQTRPRSLSDILSEIDPHDAGIHRNIAFPMIKPAFTASFPAPMMISTESAGTPPAVSPQAYYRLPAYSDYETQMGKDHRDPKPILKRYPSDVTPESVMAIVKTTTTTTTTPPVALATYPIASTPSIPTSHSTTIPQSPSEQQPQSVQESHEVTGPTSLYHQTAIQSSNPRVYTLETLHRLALQKYRIIYESSVRLRHLSSLGILSRIRAWISSPSFIDCFSHDLLLMGHRLALPVLWAFLQRHAHLYDEDDDDDILSGNGGGHHHHNNTRVNIPQAHIHNQRIQITHRNLNMNGTRTLDSLSIRDLLHDITRGTITGQTYDSTPIPLCLPIVVSGPNCNIKPTVPILPNTPESCSPYTSLRPDPLNNSYDIHLFKLVTLHELSHWLIERGYCHNEIQTINIITVLIQHHVLYPPGCTPIPPTIILDSSLWYIREPITLVAFVDKYQSLYTGYLSILQLYNTIQTFESTSPPNTPFIDSTGNVLSLQSVHSLLQQNIQSCYVALEDTPYHHESISSLLSVLHDQHWLKEWSSSCKACQTAAQNFTVILIRATSTFLTVPFISSFSYDDIGPSRFISNRSLIDQSTILSLTSLLCTPVPLLYTVPYTNTDDAKSSRNVIVNAGIWRPLLLKIYGTDISVRTTILYNVLFMSGGGNTQSLGSQPGWSDWLLSLLDDVSHVACAIRNRPMALQYEIATLSTLPSKTLPDNIIQPSERPYHTAFQYTLGIIANTLFALYMDEQTRTTPIIPNLSARADSFVLLDHGTFPSDFNPHLSQCNIATFYYPDYTSTMNEIMIQSPTQELPRTLLPYYINGFNLPLSSLSIASSIRHECYRSQLRDTLLCALSRSSSGDYILPRSIIDTQLALLLGAARDRKSHKIHLHLSSLLYVLYIVKSFIFSLPVRLDKAETAESSTLLPVTSPTSSSLTSGNNPNNNGNNTIQHNKFGNPEDIPSSSTALQGNNNNNNNNTSSSHPDDVAGILSLEKQLFIPAYAFVLGVERKLSFTDAQYKLIPAISHYLQGDGFVHYNGFPILLRHALEPKTLLSSKYEDLWCTLHWMEPYGLDHDIDILDKAISLIYTHHFVEPSIKTSDYTSLKRQYVNNNNNNTDVNSSSESAHNDLGIYVPEVNILWEYFFSLEPTFTKPTSDHIHIIKQIQKVSIFLIAARQFLHLMKSNIHLLSPRQINAVCTEFVKTEDIKKVLCHVFQ